MSRSIFQLNRVESVTATDLVALFSAGQTGTVAANMTAVQKYMQDNLLFPTGKPVTQRATPVGSGENIDILGGPSKLEDVFLIVTPISGFFNLLITLPSVTSDNDKQRVTCVTTQSFISLTVNGSSGAVVLNAPTSFATTEFFTMQYDAATNTWYRFS